MQAWILLGIFSYLSYAVSTSIDKSMMDKGYSPLGTNCLKLLFDGLILLAVGFAFFGFDFSFEAFLGGAVLGGISAFSGVLYFISLKLEDIEVVIPYMQAASILLVFVSCALLFNEAVTWANCAGLGLVIAGAYAVLSRPGGRLPKIGKAFFIVLAFVLIGTVHSLLVKALLFEAQPISLATAIYFSGAAFSAAYILLFKKGARISAAKTPKVFAAAFFGAMGTLLLFSALAEGFASKVYALVGLQSVFIFLIAFFLFRQRFCLHRLAGIGLVFAGIFLVAS